MKRLDLFEFEDYNWLPSFIRSSITKLIVVLHKMMGTSEVITSLILQIKSHYNFNQIIDLGSGSGGAMMDVSQSLNTEHSDPAIKMILTDLHPNQEFVTSFNAKGFDNLQYHTIPVDAVHLDQAPPGLKTMVNSFHHMNSTVALKILDSAQTNKQPILIYEIGKNNIPTVIWALFLPLSLAILILMVWFMTPFCRPLDWKQLLFTYLIPIIPVVYAWDGQASIKRMYTFSEIQDMINTLPTDDYQWKFEDARKINGRKLGYYILGYPKT